MLKVKPGVRLYLAESAVDMRKSIDGLSALVAEALADDPFSGKVFVFYNRCRNKLKVLVWDKNGFMLVYKRLMKGRFKIPKHWPGDRLEIDENELEWLLAGFDFQLLKARPELNFKHVF